MTASVLDRKWRYVPSYATDIRRTIAAAMRKLRGKQTRVKVEA
jgi:hypothetical protein